MSTAGAVVPRVGLCGIFDVELLSELIPARVFDAELQRRGMVVRTFAPYGAERPLPLDGGYSAETLGPPTPARRAQLAGELDCMVITGDVLAGDAHFALLYDRTLATLHARSPSAWFIDGLGPSLEEDRPVIWSCIGAPEHLAEDVRERIAAVASRRRLSWRSAPPDWHAGAEGPHRKKAVVTELEPVLLTRRLLTADVLQRRARLLRLLGCLPSGRFIAIESTPATPKDALDRSRVLRESGLGITVFSVDGRPSAQRAVTSLVEPFGDQVQRLPLSSGIEDVAAAIKEAAGVVARSRAGVALALSMGAPVTCVRGDPSAESLARACGVEVGDVDAIPRAARGAQGCQALESALDAEFDRVTALAREAAGGGGRSPAAKSRVRLQAVEPDVESLIRALEVLQRRLVDERTVMQAEVARIDARLRHVEASWSYRLLEPARLTYRRLRRR